MVPAHWSSAAGGREDGSMAWESTGGLLTGADPEACLSGQPKTGRWVALRFCACGCCPCPQRGPGESAGHGPFKSPQGAPPRGGDTWPARGGGSGGLAGSLGLGAGAAEAPSAQARPPVCLLPPETVLWSGAFPRLSAGGPGSGRAAGTLQVSRHYPRAAVEAWSVCLPAASHT